MKENNLYSYYYSLYKTELNFLLNLLDRIGFVENNKIIIFNHKFYKYNNYSFCIKTEGEFNLSLSHIGEVMFYKYSIEKNHPKELMEELISILKKEFSKELRKNKIKNIINVNI